VKKSLKINKKTEAFVPTLVQDQANDSI